MAKWKCLFEWVKRLFTSEPKEKKQKKWGWSLGRFKLKQNTRITAASRTLIDAKTKRRKHAWAMAIATAAAAEAAVAAAHAAADVVRLTGASHSNSYLSKGGQILASIQIQSAYRAHLARKALRALKGVARLQAIVRGQAVRRQVSSTMKKVPSNGREQAEILEEISHSEGESYKNDSKKQFIKQKKKLEEKAECCGQRTWDCSSHSREDIEAIWLRKQEAIIKRERMKRYSCSHREITIRQMVEESVFNKELHGTTQIAQRNLKIEDLQDQGLSSPISVSRRSFSHVKKSSVSDESSMPNSPVFPTYMALTESSKAKARSLSTPRERTRLLDVCYSQSVPQKEGTSFWSSYHGATTSAHEKSEASQKRGKSANSLSYN